MPGTSQDSHSWFRPGFSIRPLWRAITFLSVLLVSAGLFVTGEVQPAVCIAFVVAWFIGFFFDQPPAWWRHWMSLAISWAVVAFVTYVTYKFHFQGVLDLLLFLAIAKCFTLKTDRDFLQAQILCFFILISTSVITVSFYFILFFIGYILLGTLALLLYGISRSDPSFLDPPTAAPAGPSGRAAASLLPNRLGASGPLIVLLVFAFIIPFFVLIPHFSMERLDSPLSRRRAFPDRISGYSDEVTLGQFKSITPDPTVVMRVEVSWPDGAPDRRPDYIRLRGTPLEYYDESRWSRSPQRRQFPVTDNRQLLPRINSLQRGRPTKFKVYQNPDVTTRIFTVPLPTEIDFNRDQQVRYDDTTVSAQILSFGRSRESAYTNPFVYELQSNMVEEFTPFLADFVEMQRTKTRLLVEGLRSGDDEFARQNFIKSAKARGDGVAKVGWLSHGRPPLLQPTERLINLQLPHTKLTERIRELAERQAAGPTKPEIVYQLASYLKKNFRYTINPETPPTLHPIDAFLFRSPQGHCEFFATSLVLMLRTRGIPARMVNGFYTTEWNDLAQVFVAKQSDAHAWVEAWLEGAGWVTIDPTPPGHEGRLAYGLGLSSWAERWQEYLRIQWQRYVIDYSVNKQLALFKLLKSMPGVRLGFDGARSLREAYDSVMRAESAPAKEAIETNPRTAWATITDISVILLVLLGGRQVYLRLTRGGRDRRGLSGIDYFDALLRKLERLGRRRHPAQTPAEFILSLEDAGLAGADLQWLVQLYYRHRYAGEPPAPPERKRAIDIVQQLKPQPDAQHA